MRLIDADALKEEISGLNVKISGVRSGKTFLCELLTTFGKHLLQTIDNAPTIDAVPVVRCSECRYYKQNPYSTKRDMRCQCWVDWLPTEPDDFCSYGERRSDG